MTTSRLRLPSLVSSSFVFLIFKFIIKFFFFFFLKYIQFLYINKPFLLPMKLWSKEATMTL